MTDETILISQAGKYLSQIRLHQYNKNPLKQKGKIIELYFINLSVSQEIMGLISLFEVIFRNKIHNSLNHLDYLDKSSKCLGKGDYNIIAREERKIYKGKKPPKNIESRLISNLSLGFWCNLFKNKKLWSRHFCKVFDKNVRRKNAITHGKVNEILKKIQIIRNKIAHHERVIYKRDLVLESYIDSIVQITEWLVTGEDIEFLNCLSKEFERRKSAIILALK